MVSVFTFRADGNSLNQAHLAVKRYPTATLGENVNHWFQQFCRLLLIGGCVHHLFHTVLTQEAPWNLSVLGSQIINISKTMAILKTWNV